MPARRQRLTQRLASQTRPAAGDLYLWDSEAVGFGLKVTPAGARSFVLQYRQDGRSRRYAIGRLGSPWTVEAARERARVLLGEIAQGLDPQDAKLGARREPTVAELCELFLAEGMITRKPSSIASARSVLLNHVIPMVGRKKLSELSRADIERLLAQVAAGATRRRYRGVRKRAGTVRVRGGKGAATSAVVALSGALSFAVRRDLIAHNVALGVRKFPSRRIERFLSAAELARLGEALAAAHALGLVCPYRIAAIRLLILTGCRRGEILSLKRSYVDTAHSCLRLPDSKTGAKVVHVGQAALAVIAACEEIPGNPYLLPGRGGEGHICDLQSTWEEIRAAAGLCDVRLHDLRHSFASLGAAAGDSLLVIGALLGHRSTTSTERYAHLADQPVKGAAERICAEIARLLGGPARIAREAAPSVEADATADMPTPEPLKALLGEVVRTRWLDTRAAAARSGHTVGTLATYRWLGVGPAFRQVKSRIVYAEDELDAWIAAGKRTLPLAPAAGRRPGPAPALEA